MDSCVFCDIIAARAPAKVVAEWYDAVAFEPLNPVTEGHVLVVPREHVRHLAQDPEVSAVVMRRASEIARDMQACNVITSMGESATQTVLHLHLHVVPRHPGDGLALPWTGQK